MKSYVITIPHNDNSNVVADRCIESGKVFNTHIEKWDAFTPKNCHPTKLLEYYGIPSANFDEIYSDTEACKCVFLSHYSLWEHCVKIKEQILILEHDAVLVSSIPQFKYAKFVNFAKPSYGKFKIPEVLGLNSQSSKYYLGGAHGYMINPYSAQRLIEQAKINPKPADVFMDVRTFPFIQEYWPWPIECHDYFSTVQKTQGCLAKHNYNKYYETIEDLEN